MASQGSMREHIQASSMNSFAKENASLLQKVSTDSNNNTDGKSEMLHLVTWNLQTASQQETAMNTFFNMHSGKHT